MADETTHSDLSEDRGAPQDAQTSGPTEASAPAEAITTESGTVSSLIAADAADAEIPAGSAVLGASPAAGPAEDAVTFTAPELSSAAGQGLASIEMLDDVELDVKIELGRTNMYIEDVLKLGAGSVVPLDKLAGDPVDIYVNERLVAHGEVLVLNDSFCVRINDIHSPLPETEDG